MTAVCTACHGEKRIKCANRWGKEFDRVCGFCRGTGEAKIHVFYTVSDIAGINYGDRNILECIIERINEKRDREVRRLEARNKRLELAFQRSWELYRKKLKELAVLRRQKCR